MKAIAVLLSVAAMTSGCGYSLAGRGSFLPAHIQVVGIPQLANTTPFFQVEQVLTEKLRTEFIGRGKYRIVPETQGVDAVLTGEITGVSITPLTVNTQQLASRYTITMTARADLRDTRDNKVLWENASLVFREEYEAQGGVAGAVDPAAFFGQDQNALDRMTTEFSRSIVSAILEAF